MSSVSSAAPGASRSASAAPTVAAVVVTFNRKALLKQCLEALLAQTQALEAIFIIDNASTDGTEAMLRGEGLLDRPELRYVRLPVNSGGAGGFCEGVKVATAQGFDWIWLMDDDAFAAANALEILASHLDDPSIVAVAPAVYTQGAIVEWHREMLSGCPGFFKLTVPVPSERYREPAVEIDIASFVGVLVRSSAVRQIGYPAADFFIHCDDREYSLRLRNQGRILLVPASVMTHEEAA
ncbi:MAG TPA: glycosyltransferase, partial [Pirellulales bacterium]|nr:glycosyltransferase [Pirellulales bacterium]